MESLKFPARVFPCAARSTSRCAIGSSLAPDSWCFNSCAGGCYDRQTTQASSRRRQSIAKDQKGHRRFMRRLEVARPACRQAREKDSSRFCGWMETTRRARFWRIVSNRREGLLSCRVLKRLNQIILIKRINVILDKDTHECSSPVCGSVGCALNK